MKNLYSKANASPTKTYYLPGDPSKTPLTHEEFKDIMRPFWKQRKKLQRAGECNAPAWHDCMCDCGDCPYRLSGETIPMETLERIGEGVLDPYCMEDDVANRLFEQQIYRCLPQLDTIDRIIIRCTVLHKGHMPERQMAALISKAVGREFTHQAVHKRIPAAARRLAALMDFDLDHPYE